MSIFERFRHYVNILPDRFMHEIGEGVGLFLMVMAAPLLLFTTHARRARVFPFSGGYLLRFTALYALLIAGGLFFFARSVAQPDFFMGMVDNTVGKDNMSVNINMNRGIRLVSQLPPFEVKNGVLTGDIPDGGVTVFDAIRVNNVRDAIIHVTDLETRGDILFPGDSDTARPSLVLHAAGAAFKRGKDPYEEKTYAELEQTKIGEIALLTYFTDITPPEGGYSLLDAINLAGAVGGTLPHTYYKDATGFIPAEGETPAPARFFRFSEKDDTPRLYIDLNPGATLPDADSDFLAVVTDKIILWRLNTSDRFTPVLLTSLSQRDMYRQAGRFMRSVQRVLNVYFWPLVFPAILLLMYGCIKIIGIVGASAACVVTRRPDLRPVYRSGASLCGAVLILYTPVLLFSGALRGDIIVAAFAAFYIVLAYIDTRRLRSPELTSQQDTP